jgi:two-component system OmpR family response regulator
MAHKILLLDDDRDFRALVRMWLERRGHRVIEAESGKVAERLMAETRPDLVIVDGLLPDTDGFRWIKERRLAGDETPMVFTSFFYKDMESFNKLTGELRVRRVLAKTMGQHDFVQAIEAVLGAEQVAAAVPVPRRPPTPVPVVAKGSINMDSPLEPTERERALAKLIDDEISAADDPPTPQPK